MYPSILACLSGAQMGSNHEKNRGQKSCDTLALKTILYCKDFLKLHFKKIMLGKRVFVLGELSRIWHYHMFIVSDQYAKLLMLHCLAKKGN